MAATTNWQANSVSRYSWEQEALEFVRAQFPRDEPYRAWSNFEFIADDGSINEVDLLVFTPAGLFLIEIKSHLGRLTGDAGTWTWIHEGRHKVVDNPLNATNLKAKRLRSLLERQKAFKKGRVPFIEPLVFCSGPQLQIELEGNARLRVCPRDRPKTDTSDPRPGIMAAILRRECPGLEGPAKGTHDKPTAKLVAQAMDQAGIRVTRRHRTVYDCELTKTIGDGPGYQDWEAHHTQSKDVIRRVRLYLVREGATAEERQMRERAALREFQLLETLQHPGVLRIYGYTEHEVGSALIFEHDPVSIRLDHFLRFRADSLSFDVRLDLVRQLAEVVRFAHDKRVVHRALCPQSILVTAAASERPRLKVFNWQVGYRESSSLAGASPPVSATSHMDRLVDRAGTPYMAPEALSGDAIGEHLDIFSLGAIAYHIFSGQPPATDAIELGNRLRDTTGLQISSVLNGAGEWLQLLIQEATHPVVLNRTDSVAQFLETLDEVEEELTAPDHEYGDDPTRATAGDILPSGYRVVRRIGQGSTCVALLVEKEGQDYILKVANAPEQNARVKDEADVLGRQLRHPHIVEWIRTIELGDRMGILLRPVFADREKKSIETLGKRVRDEGPLQIDLLHRFGEDLLGVVTHLEEQGIPHRDIKPENIAIGMVGRGHKLHLVLFDFSLSRTLPENIRAGTEAYLDPFLPLRKPAPPRWDLHAERYSAALTLYELATGQLPQWGDGKSAPSQLSPTVEITLDPEKFDPGLREPLIGFFRQALRRNIAERFDNAEEMLQAWRDCFRKVDQVGGSDDPGGKAELAQRLVEATFNTPITELGLGTRATNALDRANILTVANLLTISPARLQRLKGVGHKTRREILAAVRILRERLGRPAVDEEAPVIEPDPPVDPLATAAISVDLLADRLLKTASREGDTVTQVVRSLLGLGESGTWPAQADIARSVGVTRARVGQVVSKLQERWSNDPALTRLRTDIEGLLASQGGVMTIPELAEAILVARGSLAEEPLRTTHARGVLRAVLEVDRTLAEPKLVVRRSGEQVVVALSAELLSWAEKLGTLADELAAEDPLAASPRIVQRLREAPAPADIDIADTRLVRLAAAVSQTAAVSSRQELYPCGMPALRALKLSQGAIFGVNVLTIPLIRERVGSRYPDAAPLPDRPQLDELLREAGFEFEWDPVLKEGQGAYTSKGPGPDSGSTGSISTSRRPTLPGRGEPGVVTPEEADARQFEEKLQRALADGAFLCLQVPLKHFDSAREKICERFPNDVEVVDLEEVLLDALQEVVVKARVDWELVLKTDAAPNQGDWDKLLMLVGRAMPAVEARLLQAKQTMLVLYAGLLARYGQMDFLSRLSQKVGRQNGIPGLWLLLAGEQPLLDGKSVPLIGPGQRARIPQSWIRAGLRETERGVAGAGPTGSTGES